MNNTEKLWALNEVIKQRVPDYKIKFKDESTFMKILGKILFFNKNFMTTVTTVIGKTIYLPKRSWFEQDPGYYFYTLCHEYVHVMDFVRKPVRFTLGYLFPQILAIFSFGALFSFINIWFLSFLLFLLFLLPLPALFRADAECRGYGMSIKVRLWDNVPVAQSRFDMYVNHFVGPNYYYMWPFKNNITHRLSQYLKSDDCLKDVEYHDVSVLLKNS